VGGSFFVGFFVLGGPGVGGLNSGPHTC
jgi:hypothetical protein